MSDAPPSQSALVVPQPPGVLERLLRFHGVREIPLPELQARYENAESRYIEVDGTRVHYRVEGQGPPLLLLHGVLAHLQTWDGWVERMKAHFTIYRLDIPGFGLTGPMAGGDYSPEYALTFFEAARQALGLERFAVAGNSLGGFLAWYYAAHQPERVERLILLDPLCYPQAAPTVMRFAMLPVIRSIAPHCVPRFFVTGSLWQVYGDRSRLSPELVSRYHELLLRPGNRRAMLEYFAKAEMIFAVDEDGHGRYARHVPKIRCPVLVMWGEQDAWIPPAHADAFQRDLPHAQVKRYPGVGHMPMEEIPELTARDALAFLLG